jgi:hypothetical protein
LYLNRKGSWYSNFTNLKNSGGVAKGAAKILVSLHKKHIKKLYFCQWGCKMIGFRWMGRLMVSGNSGPPEITWV